MECFDLEQDVNTAVSWYEATARRDAVLPPLAENVTADVCVVGAGFAGLTTALELARLGKSVVLLEAGRIAGGASGRNGGFVSNGFALGIKEVEKHVGRDDARMLYDFSRMGTDYVRNTIAKHAPQLKSGDGLRVCVRHDDKGSLHEHGRMLQDDYGEEVLLASVSETRALLDTKRYFASIAYPNAFHVHPLRYGMLKVLAMAIWLKLQWETSRQRMWFIVCRHLTAHFTNQAAAPYCRCPHMWQSPKCWTKPSSEAMKRLPTRVVRAIIIVS
jgi:FAD dependent oxidoreductase